MEAITKNEEPVNCPKYNQLKDMDCKYFRDQKPPQFGKDDKTKWTDPLFPPEEASLLTEEYKKEKLTPEKQVQVKQEIRPEKIEWKRFSDVLGDNFHIFEDKIEISDIIQGKLSDGYLLSALAALSQYPDYIFQIVRTKDPSPNGVYEVLLFIDGEWQIVLVDDYFPYEKGTSNLMFTKTNGTELWVILLEKAWAKINGGYANIVLGQVSDAFQALTGFSSQTIQINTSWQKEVWENLTNSDNKDYIMCSNTINDNYLEDVNLVSGHYYSLIKAKEVNYSQKTFQLIQLYNPWGRHEWNGDWSDSSPLWTDELKRKFGKPESEEGKSYEDGQFFMDVNDYIKYFETIYICNMMYGASLKTFDIPAKWARKPLVFTFTLIEDCNVTLSVFFKHWRFNRDLQGIIRPFSLVFARIKKEGDPEVEYFDGDYSVRDDIQASRRLLKGKYVVWLYSIAEEVKEENFTFKFRIAADKKYSVVFVGEDKDLKIIKHLILSNRKRIMKDTKTVSDIEFKEDAEVIKAGLRAFYGINKSPKISQEVQFSFGTLKDIRILENKYKVKKTEYILLHPGHDILILGAKLGLEKNDKFQITPTKKISNEKYEVVAQDTSFWNDLNSPVDAEKLKIQEYSFSSVDDLRFLKPFETMGKKKIENYNKEDLYAENGFAAKKLFKLLDKNGRKDHALTIDQEVKGIYMGEKPPKEREHIYYGARINNILEEIYIGCFRDNRYHLKGKFYKQGVLSYDGEYKEGKREGKGILYSENCDEYLGTFKDDRKKGLFRIYHENTNSMSVVFMDNDKRHGYAMEVNYPQRNTRIAYYQNDMLITFLVVEYEFFKVAFDLDKFGADDTFPEQFKKSLENKFPIKGTTDLLLRKIWTERNENMQCRAKDPFMYDMLRELSYSFITQIKVRPIKYDEYTTSSLTYEQLFNMEQKKEDYMMITWEKTDKAYYLSKHNCYIFFLGIGNEKPLYDKNVRWLMFSKDHTLLYEGGYEHRHNAKYFQSKNGEFLHALAKGKAYYFYPNRGYAYGDYSFEATNPMFSLYNFSGFWNNYIYIRQVIKAEPIDKKLYYFIPKKEVEELHFERMKGKGGIDNFSENQEIYNKLVYYINKHYPWFYVLPTEKTCEGNDDLSFFRLEFEYNRISLIHLGLPIYTVIKESNDKSDNEIIEFKSSFFGKGFGRIKRRDNYEFIGGIKDDKRHGRGVENFEYVFEDEKQKTKTLVNKTIHMTYNENERDGYNFEFDMNRKCEAYNYNDGIKSTKKLNLAIYDKDNLIGKNEKPEERRERRIRENVANLESLRDQYGDQYGVLLNLCESLEPSGTPYLIWYWKYTIDGIYIGEVDPFFQSCGRGILLYNSHSMKQGAYVGYWTADIRHGQGIHVNLEKKKTYFASNYYLNEQDIKSPIKLNEVQLKILIGFEEEQPLDFSSEIVNPTLIEHDTEDKQPKEMKDELETFQWFVNKNEHYAQPSVDEMKQTFNKIDALRKLFVIE